MKNILSSVIKEALKKLNIEEIDVEISKPALEENGDFSSNVAMKLAKVLKRNPLEIAKEIVENVNSDQIINIEIKNPGFINFFVKKFFYLSIYHFY